jgi:nucleoside-diphosphate-sugar epimerase
VAVLTCAVTGANGFIGRCVAQRFLSLGWRVVSILHRPEAAPAGTEARRLVLGEPVAPGMLAGIDVLVHAAYDFSLRSWADICRVNVVGSEYLFDAATRAGIGRSIFISSLAAFEGCRSLYGRGKLAVEDSVRVRGGVSIRPGMVYPGTTGSLIEQVASMSRRFPVIPVIGHGDYPVYTCHVDDLCELVAWLADTEEFPDGVLVAANPSPTTLRELVRMADGGRSRMIVSVPWRWVVAGLWIAEHVGLRPGFRGDSVASHVHPNPAMNFAATTTPVRFRAFGWPDRDIGIPG